MRAKPVSFLFPRPARSLSRFLIGEKAEPLQRRMLGVIVPGARLPDSVSMRMLKVGAGLRGLVGWLSATSNMAPTMLVLLVPPLPVARGLLWNCWKRQLQRKLLQSRPGFPVLHGVREGLRGEGGLDWGLQAAWVKSARI